MGAAKQKSEIQISKSAFAEASADKSETNSKSECSNFQNMNCFELWLFDIVSYLVFRTSNFPICRFSANRTVAAVGLEPTTLGL